MPAQRTVQPTFPRTPRPATPRPAQPTVPPATHPGGGVGILTAAPVRAADPLDSIGATRASGSAAAVLRAVLDRGPVARAVIGQATGLSPAAVSRQTADLISLGLLRELPSVSVSPRAGRPHVPLDIDTERYLACGVHISVPKVTFGLVDLRGKAVASESVPHQGDPRQVLTLVGRHLPGFVRRHRGDGQLLGLGVVTGGRVDTRDGVVVEHGPLGWRNVPVGQVLSEDTGLPVYVDNHARALAQAEVLFGEPRSRRSLVHLFVGNVVDAAIAIGGTVLHGPRSGAGDVAHLRLPGSDQRCRCGGSGCAEATLTEGVWLERATAAGIIARPDVTLLVAAALDGEARAVAMLRARLRLIGRLVAVLLDLIDPEVLVLTEAATISIPHLMSDLYDEVAVHSRRCVALDQVVRPSSFGPDVLAVAAGASLLDAVHRIPRSLSYSRPFNGADGGRNTSIRSEKIDARRREARG